MAPASQTPTASARLPNPRSRSKRWKQASAKWIRWLHIYGSMFSCALVLFFSLTGITLNHPSWFGGDQAIVREVKGKLNQEWLPNDSEKISKLEIVEHLRITDQVRGAMKDFTVDETQCIVAFRGPGYTADTFIDRESGEYELVISSMGWVAIMNDLHKGRDSGAAWAWLIDLSALMLVFVSGTGLLLLFYINSHRKAGLITSAIGVVATLVFYLILVPN